MESALLFMAVHLRILVNIVFKVAKLMTYYMTNIAVNFDEAHNLLKLIAFTVFGVHKIKIIGATQFDINHSFHICYSPFQLSWSRKFSKLQYCMLS